MRPDTLSNLRAYQRQLNFHIPAAVTTADLRVRWSDRVCSQRGGNCWAPRSEALLPIPLPLSEKAMRKDASPGLCPHDSGSGSSLTVSSGPHRWAVIFGLDIHPGAWGSCLKTA